MPNPIIWNGVFLSLFSQMIGTYEFRHIQREISQELFTIIQRLPVCRHPSPHPLECRTKCVRMGTQRGRQELLLRVERQKEQKGFRPQLSNVSTWSQLPLHTEGEANNDEWGRTVTTGHTNEKGFRKKLKSLCENGEVKRKKEKQFVYKHKKRIYFCINSTSMNPFFLLSFIFMLCLSICWMVYAYSKEFIHTFQFIFVLSSRDPSTSPPALFYILFLIISSSVSIRLNAGIGESTTGTANKQASRRMKIIKPDDVCFTWSLPH